MESPAVIAPVVNFITRAGGAPVGSKLVVGIELGLELGILLGALDGLVLVLGEVLSGTEGSILLLGIPDGWSVGTLDREGSWEG